MYHINVIDKANMHTIYHILTSIWVISFSSGASNENVSSDPGKKLSFWHSSKYCLPVWRFFLPNIFMKALLSVPWSFSYPVCIRTVYGIAEIIYNYNSKSRTIEIHLTFNNYIEYWNFNLYSLTFYTFLLEFFFYESLVSSS